MSHRTKKDLVLQHLRAHPCLGLHTSFHSLKLIDLQRGLCNGASASLSWLAGLQISETLWPASLSGNPFHSTNLCRISASHSTVGLLTKSPADSCSHWRVRGAGLALLHAGYAPQKGKSKGPSIGKGWTCIHLLSSPLRRQRGENHVLQPPWHSCKTFQHLL